MLVELWLAITWFMYSYDPSEISSSASSGIMHTIGVNNTSPMGMFLDFVCFGVVILCVCLDVSFPFSFILPS